jgi:hypothetical protein
MHILNDTDVPVYFFLACTGCRGWSMEYPIRPRSYFTIPSICPRCGNQTKLTITEKPAALVVESQNRLPPPPK